METNEQNQHKQRNRLLKSALIVIGILLLLALIFMTISIRRGGRLSSENMALQTERNLLTEEGQKLLADKNKSIAEVNALKEQVVLLQSDFDEQLRTRDAQISTLRSRTRQTEQLRKQVEDYKVLETEYKKLQDQHALLVTDKEGMNTEIENLSNELVRLKESIEKSEGLHAYNISPLTKWDRWFWADRYNVSRARRVNETAISFEVAGNSFTKTGNRTIYLNMIDPLGAVMYPSSEVFTIKENGEESSFTQKKQINYTGSQLPVSFVINHPERLIPGTYRIKVYVDGDLIRSSDLVFE